MGRGARSRRWAQARWEWVQCDRCERGFEPTGGKFKACAECGPVWLCPDCETAHLAELAEQRGEQLGLAL